MDHTRAQELFSDFAEGTLPRTDAQSVRAHLESCASCNREFEAFSVALVQLGQLRGSQPVPSSDFLRGIEGEIRRRSRGRFFSKRQPKFPLELISLVTLLILIVLYLFFVVTQPSKVHEGAPVSTPGGQR